MKIKHLMSAFAGCAMIALASLTASAQTGRLEGDVIKADTKEPIIGAEIQIERTDIKGSYPVKTDKKGHFLHAGVPYVGTYTVLVSAPGFQPDFAQGIKGSYTEPIKFELQPGDGKKLTLADVKGLQASAPKGGQQQISAADQKKAIEENQKKRAEIEAKNKKAQEDHEQMKKIFEQGLQLASNKDYPGAINAYNEAAKLDPEQKAVWGNLSIALFNRGATQLNANQRDAAKQDFLDAINAASKTLALLETEMSDPAKANDPALKKSKIDYLKLKVRPAAVLAERYGDPEQAEAAIKAYQAIVDASDDPATKLENKAKIAQTHFQVGRVPESTNVYKEMLQTAPDNLDALYGLGLIYSLAEDTKTEAVTMWSKFLEKAPANDTRVAMVQEGVKTLGVDLAPAKSDKGAKGKRKP
jgi:tetratricopeptide (TPR) repeat protein